MENNTLFDERSIDVLLNTAKTEYDNENSRVSVIYSKTGISLPIIAAYFLALAQMNDYKSIYMSKINSFSDIIIPLIMFLSYTISLVLVILAVFFMSRVIMTHGYSTINPSDLYDNEYLTEHPVFITTKLITLYISASTFNKKQNSLRVKLYRRGWLFTAISIFLFVIYIILKNNI